MNSNSAYDPSISSVIVKNNGPSRSASVTPEVYAANRTPTILTVPAIKMDKERKQAKPVLFPQSLSSPGTTSQTEGNDTSQEPSYPGPLLNTHGRYEMYPPNQLPNQTQDASFSPNLAHRDLEYPPPAHLNTTITSVLPKSTPVTVSEDYFQTEPLDLVVMCKTKSSAAVDVRETHVPLQYYTGNNSAKPDPQETTINCGANDYYKAERLNNIETSLPPNTFISSPDMVSAIYSAAKSMDISIFPSTKAVTASSANPMTIPNTISSVISVANSTAIPNPIPYSVPIINSKTVPTSSWSSSLASYPKNIVATVSNNISPTIPTDIPITTTADIPATVFTPSSSTLPASISTSTPTIPTNSLLNQDSSPSTPPPVLIPEIRTEMTYGMKTYHHKLKKAWLQRHEWAEDLKGAGVIIDQGPSNTYSELDDTPPVLQRQITNKRKQTKSISENNVNLNTISGKLQSDSEPEPGPSNYVPKKYKKRKMSNSTGSDNKDSTESDKDGDSAKKKVSDIKIPKKRGRKPKVMVSIPLKNGTNHDGEISFFQSGPCISAGPKTQKCRECRAFLNKKKKGNVSPEEVENIFCRFYAFRRLFTNKNGQFVSAGFPSPFYDVSVVR